MNTSKNKGHPRVRKDERKTPLAENREFLALSASTKGNGKHSEEAPVQPAADKEALAVEGPPEGAGCIPRKGNFARGQRTFESPYSTENVETEKRRESGRVRRVHAHHVAPTAFKR